jgi:2,3-bisphosphoglycerate-independent phosphoglycerate mutase
MAEKRKFVILVGDGMADWPGDFHHRKTPLVSADTPVMDRMASRGESGLVRTIPEGMKPGSDVANMSLMGYDPQRFYSGRSPLEAASMGVDLLPHQVAYRLNLVFVRSVNGGVMDPEAVMTSYSAGHISSDEARAVIEDLERELGRPGRRFYPGVSYRHLLVLDGAPLSTTLTPPHDITGKPIKDYLPSGEGSGELLEIMEAAAPILAGHPVNKARLEKGLEPASSIWLWGQGKKPAMPSFSEEYGRSGAVISAVDLIKGLGRVIGLEVIYVPGATGYLDTNYEGKVAAAMDVLGEKDFAFVHVEAPDEAGHQGDLDAKIQAIGDFDARVVGPVLERIKKYEPWSVMVATDHSTPLSIMTHSSEPVPYAILRSGDQGKGGKRRGFNELALADAEVLSGGETLMRMFLGGG